MPKIRFILPNGDVQDHEAMTGHSIMQASRDAGVDSIIGECGGVLSCATCHVYIDEAWTNRTGPAGEPELELIECVVDPRPNSRLCCQILMSETLDGIVITVPKAQF
jgi:2Fe-2S ferredoxin